MNRHNEGQIGSRRKWGRAVLVEKVGVIKGVLGAWSWAVDARGQSIPVCCQTSNLI